MSLMLMAKPESPAVVQECFEDHRHLILGIDAEVKSILTDDNDPSFADVGIKGIESTPDRFVFDQVGRPVAKISMFYIGPSVGRARRGIMYSTVEGPDDYTKTYTYSWHPVVPEDERYHNLKVIYTNDKTGDSFSAESTGLNELDLADISEVIKIYKEAKHV